MEKDLPLLSDELLNVAKFAESSKTPVLRYWVESHIDSDAIKNGCFDEVDLLARTERMLRGTDCFVFEPEIVAALRSSFMMIMARQQEYLLFALTLQKSRLKKLLEDPDFNNIEKRESGLRRYVERAHNELASYDDPEERARLEESFRLKVANAEKRMRRRLILPGNGTLAEIITIIAVQPEVRKIQEELLDGIKKRFEKTKKSIDELSQQLSITEKRAKTKRNLSEILAKTNIRLRELEPETTTPDNITPVDSSRKTVIKLPEDKPAVPKETPSGRVIPSPIPPVPEAQSADNAETKIASDVERIRDAIRTANETTGKIRILSSADLIGSFRESWETLLRNLGFDGTIELCSYKVLKRSTDFTSPVIVPKRMNTHKNLWNQRPFATVIVTEISQPNLIKKRVKPNGAQFPDGQ